MADETGGHERGYEFDNCWIDKDTPVVTINIAGTEFRLRAITAGEHQEVRANALLQPQGSKSLTDAASRIYDNYRVTIGEVAAALGAFTKLGNEGWSDPRPVTVENVRALSARVLFILSNKSAEFFLGGSGRPAELGENPLVECGAADENMVSAIPGEDG